MTGFNSIPAETIEHDVPWHRWFLGLAQYAATRSKDPSTKVGAVIVRPDRTVASLGCNGMPRGVRDLSDRLHDREQKYPRVVHAELNAILNSRDTSLEGYTLYCTLHPCSQCAGAIIQAGITRVVCPDDPSADYDRWKSQMSVAESMFGEAGVLLSLVTP